MSESIYLIYKHTSPSGKSYVGQTNDLSRRTIEHQHPDNGCRAFRNAIRKYGWDNFTHEILAENLTLDEANRLEEQYIIDHNTLAPSGYNLTTGGNSRKLSDETRQLLAHKRQIEDEDIKTRRKEAARLATQGKSRSPEIKAKISQTLTGTTRPDEVKQKVAAAHLGKPLSEEHKAKIAATRLKGVPRSEETKRKMREAAAKRKKEKGS